MKTWSKIGRYIKTFLKTIVICGCMGFTFWQTWKCIEKFILNPQSTEIELKTPFDTLKPQLAICRLPSESNDDWYFYESNYNETFLKVNKNHLLFKTTETNLAKLQACNIGSIEYLHHTFSSLECPDPQKVFEMASISPERIIRGIAAFGNRELGALGIHTYNLKKIHGLQDCILVEIPDFIEFLDELELTFNEDVMIAFFQKGMYSETIETTDKFTVRENEQIKVTLNYDILSRPSTSESPCIKDLEHSVDDCILQKIHEVRLLALSQSLFSGLQKF